MTVNNQPDSGAVQVVPETQTTLPTVQSSGGEQSSEPSMVHLIQVHVDIFSLLLFRWFKFTLKPTYTITHGNFLSAIWDTSHWTSFVKFGLKTA